MMTSVGASPMYCMKPRILVMNFQLELTWNHEQQDILPPVPISTKLSSDDVKQQIIETYFLVSAPSRMP